MRPIKILWVEDQLHWITKFSTILESTDFESLRVFDSGQSNELAVFRSAEAACQHLKRCPLAPDIAILDANMNGNDKAGFKVSASLAGKWPETPILFLSEHSGTAIEREAFEQGQTQDFIAKHQNNIEQVLGWRIKAALRSKALRNSVSSTASNTLTSGELLIDLGTWEVYYHGVKLMNPSNTKRPLPPLPRKILRFLVESSPRPLSTEQLAQRLDIDNFTYASYRQHIRTLRLAFDQVCTQHTLPNFLDLCKTNKGIVTFGDQGAYCWKSTES